MKKEIALLFLSCFISAFAQDSLPISKIKLKSQIFSLSPISKKVDVVNGLAFGVGHYDDKNIVGQTINGVNVEASPIGLAFPFLLFLSFDKRFDRDAFTDGVDDGTNIKINGINISSGGFLTNAQMNGINISTLTQIRKMNGLSVCGFITVTNNTNGVSIAGFQNLNQKTNGLQIAISNFSDHLKGGQIGLYNNCAQSMTGVQIGLLNISNKTRGLQIGLLNINKKRALPFINF